MARNLTHLLMSADPAHRPDGLIVLDDNLHEHVLAGLENAGIRSGRDLRLVVQSNFPHVVPSTLPAERVGYHVGQMLETCLDLLDLQREGHSVSLLTLLPAVREQEAAKVNATVQTQPDELEAVLVA